jgi:hypothetical protein
MIEGQYARPLHVIALNPVEGWSRDVSEEIAIAVLRVARVEGRVLPAGTNEFVEEQRYAPHKASRHS